MEDTQINLMWYLREGKGSSNGYLCHNRANGEILNYKWWNVATKSVTFEEKVIPLEEAEEIFIVEFSGLADAWKEPAYKRALQEYNNRVISSPKRVLTAVINKPKIIQFQVEGDCFYGLGDDGIIYSSYKGSPWEIQVEGL